MAVLVVMIRLRERAAARRLFHDGAHSAGVSRLSLSESQQTGDPLTSHRSPALPGYAWKDGPVRPTWRHGHPWIVGKAPCGNRLRYAVRSTNTPSDCVVMWDSASLARSFYIRPAESPTLVTLESAGQAQAIAPFHRNNS